MRNYNETLVEVLHEASVYCGEILSPEHVAQIVREFEFDQGIELAPEVILSSVREAADRTCDSYIGNAYDSRSDWGDERVDDEVARWEVQRPAKVREEQLKALLKPKKVVRISNIEKDTSYLATSEKDCRCKTDVSGFQSALELGVVCIGKTVFEVL